MKRHQRKQIVGKGAEREERGQGKFSTKVLLQQKRFAESSKLIAGVSF